MISIADFWRAIPCKVMLLVTAACLLIGERYPFSDFPMFGSFSGKSYYVYLADQNGKPVPALAFGGVPTNGIKKAYDAGLKKAKKAIKKGKISEEQDRLAAVQTLRYLIKKTPRPPHGVTKLRLERVDLRLVDGQVIKVTRTAGEVPLR